MGLHVGAVAISAAVIVLAASAPASSDNEKMFSWPQLLSGDCVMVPGSQVRVHDNGDGEFSATTYTNHTHSGDVWHHTIELRDASGNSIVRLGEYDSPRMDDGNPPPRYTWRRAFHLAPSDAARVVRASVLSYSC